MKVGMSMAPGLRKILDLIRTKPNDQRLIDRYISLVNELPEAERNDATWHLSKILVSKMPDKALELSWSMFKAGSREQENLKLIAQALEVLGKAGKAAAIRADADRLTMSKLGSPEHLLARNNIEKTVQHSKNDSQTQFSESLNTKTSNNVVANFDLSNASSEPTFRDSKHESSKLHQEEKKLSQVEPVGSIQSANGKLFEAEKDRTDTNHPTASKDSKLRSSSDVASPGIPEAIPRKEPSSHSKALLSGVDSRRAEKMTVSTNELPKNLNQMPDTHNVVACHEYVSRLIGEHKWEDLIIFLRVILQNQNETLLVEIMSKNSLAKIDIHFAELWIDGLIATKQERRALRFMVGILTDEPHMAWAKMVKNCLPQITEGLGLEGVVWAEGEGVSALRRKVQLARPRLGIYVIFPPILY